ncbi:membrane cofactor protein-like [Pteropus vampyrus]|uniref:Membrane cofactor protein n=2 Tax=Pteropus vampyrus TaxID=132908 RepID=A0A6P3RQV3_PTEVA|nr:membrane cofactor protein-like [Pteropus vampyrus]
MTLKGVPKSSYSPGEKVYYYCKPGHYQLLFHSTSTYCEENSSWHPIPEGCSRKECTTPQVLNGGILDPNHTLYIGFQFDKEFHFFCDEGYYLRGEKILTCKRSGDKVYWNYDLPKCEKIFCQPPGKIKNGKHTNSWRDIFEYNELVTYSCDPSNGPEEYSLVGDSKLICSGPSTWSTDPPECKVVKCEYPVLENGRLVSGIKEKFYYQAVVLFECLKGFYLHGSNPVFCGENSTWEPEMPTCIKGLKPTRSTKPPVSRYPGYPNPSEFPLYEDFKELDPGIIAVIILTILVGIAVICTCLYKCLRRNKKG